MGKEFRMDDLLLTRIAAGTYFAAALLYCGQFILQKKRIWTCALFLSIAGFLLQVIAFFLRWWTSCQTDAGHIPVASFYESLLFFSGIMVAIGITAEIKYRNGMFGIFLLPLACLVMAAGIFIPGINNAIEPLVPALKSSWLFFHVAACIIGFAAFAATFVLGILHFFTRAAKSNKTGEIPVGEKSFLPGELLYKLSIWGFSFLTAGILSGAAWAHNAWGSYWSWDPKETSSLITWLIYLLLLHVRFSGRSNKSAAAILAIIGFLWVVLTYLGTIFFNSLHSYN
jgi:cytochrome c-type biogenesis protein CcsB